MRRTTQPVNGCILSSVALVFLNLSCIMGNVGSIMGVCVKIWTRNTGREKEVNN